MQAQNGTREKPGRGSAIRGRSVGYVRVSTSEQAERFGLDVQRERVEEFCRSEGLALVATAEDPGVSGTTPLEERPGLISALRAVEADRDITALVVARFDRLARDTLEALLIERAFTAAGARVLYAEGVNGEEDALRMMRTLMHGFAEFEKRQLVRRLADGRRAKAARGGYAGGRPPFGYEAREGELVPKDGEREVVRWIFEQVANEGRTIRQIAAALDQAGTLERPWRPSEVGVILKREAYKRGPDPIVPPRLWNRAAAALAARRRG
jgi:site-specific DNA recombinase